MFDLILILGITLSSAGLIGAPCRHRPKPCREEDTRASSRAGLLLQKDTLSTPEAVTALEQQLRSEPVQETRR